MCVGDYTRYFNLFQGMYSNGPLTGIPIKNQEFPTEVAEWVAERGLIGAFWVCLEGS